MLETSRIVRAGGCALVALLMACSGKDHQAAPPAPSPSTGPADVPAVATSQPESRTTSGGAWSAVTRQKLTDDEYRAAIADVERANGSRDAAADFGAGHRQILSIPKGEGLSRLPGVHVALEELPADVKIVRMAGVMDESSNRHILRFSLLAKKYAEDYNETMLRAVKR